MIGILNKKKIQNEIGLSNYLFYARSLINDFEIKKINRIEPTEDRVSFLKLADKLLSRYGKLGAADIWHIMASMELQNSYSSISLFSYDKRIVDAALAENITAVCGKNLVSEILVKSLKSSNRWRPED